jgi:hypothetical protein
MDNQINPTPNTNPNPNPNHASSEFLFEDIEEESDEKEVR